MAEEIRFFELNTGAKFPSVGLGTWRAKPGIVGDAVIAAVKAGYRHVDCARLYANEKEIGLALKKLFEDGVVKREDLWITSKLWCTDHAPEDVHESILATLSDLQLDYVDLYLVSFLYSIINFRIILYPDTLASSYEEGIKPENLIQPDICSTWRAMEALYDSGMARAIGVSNFSSTKLRDLIEISRIPPAVNQVECHILWQQDKLRAFCKSKGVHLSGYSPLGSRGNWLKTDVLQHPVLNVVAEKLIKTPAQVALRWGLQMGHSVLPKSTNEARIKENLNVFYWSIPQDLMSKFSEIERARQFDGAHFVHETFGPYRTIEELWDGEI